MDDEGCIQSHEFSREAMNYEQVLRHPEDATCQIRVNPNNTRLLHVEYWRPASMFVMNGVNYFRLVGPHAITPQGGMFYRAPRSSLDGGEGWRLCLKEAREPSWTVTSGLCLIDAEDCLVSPSYPATMSPGLKCEIEMKPGVIKAIEARDWVHAPNDDFQDFGVMMINSQPYGARRAPPEGVVPVGTLKFWGQRADEQPSVYEMLNRIRRMDPDAVTEEVLEQLRAATTQPRWIPAKFRLCLKEGDYTTTTTTTTEVITHGWQVEGPCMGPGFSAPNGCFSSHDRIFQSYGRGDACTINIPENNELRLRFKTWDLREGATLVVNGLEYSTYYSDRPDGVIPQGSITWSVDAESESTGEGWVLCPEEVPEWEIVSGPCVMDEDGCITSTDYPDHYEECRIHAREGLGDWKGVQVARFSVDGDGSELLVDGRKVYETGLWRLPLGKIEWRGVSELSTQSFSGWKICLEVLPTVTATTTSTTFWQAWPRSGWRKQGSCRFSPDGCISSTNYPEFYPEADACSIEVNPGNQRPLQVVAFNTELDSDILVVNDVSYAGGSPTGLDGVVPQGTITWLADGDGNRESGWKICLGQTTTTTTTAYDPFGIVCPSGSMRCEDSAGAWCDDRPPFCPPLCTGSERRCFIKDYDASGQLTGNDPGEVCVAVGSPCPCNEQWEKPCVMDTQGTQRCFHKDKDCPFWCPSGEKECWWAAYDNSGYPDRSLAAEKFCHPEAEFCPCHEEHEELCFSAAGSPYCLSKVQGPCPRFCQSNQKKCTELSYDEAGNIIQDDPGSDGSGGYGLAENEFCVEADKRCPCHSVWEQECTNQQGDTWCQSINSPCPAVCGEAAKCIHASGRESCITETGCVCEDDELTCVNEETQLTFCNSRAIWEVCPLTCQASQKKCQIHAGVTTPAGFWRSNYIDYCFSGVDESCPTECDLTTMTKCPSDGGRETCVFGVAATCPLVCGAYEGVCHLVNYDSKGERYFTSVCGDPYNCGCGENAVQCPASQGGKPFCEKASLGCPLTCGPTEKKCVPISFTAEGAPDFSVGGSETCVPISRSCPCSQNAKLCRWTDEQGQPREACQPTSRPCPVSCQATEKKCDVVDFSEDGQRGEVLEVCVPSDDPCPCGLNAQRCITRREEFCAPRVDFATGFAYRCPVQCGNDEQECEHKSFDSEGNFLASWKECSTNCWNECKGQNSFLCQKAATAFSRATRQCLPLNGGYCKPDCPEGEVACPLVVNYSPEGSSLRSVQPSVGCAADYDACPCGTEAKSCPGAGCRFKGEECPLFCGNGQKKCFVQDFSEDEQLISERQVCVSDDALCPCGQNTMRCPSSPACLLPSAAALVCPCRESETVCDVQDYTPEGKMSTLTTLCVPIGVDCPCGANSQECTDRNDPQKVTCIAEWAGQLRNRCPTPCTPEEEASGRTTCVQTNLNTDGSFQSEFISCGDPNDPDYCPPGQNMQQCPSGSVIPTADYCEDLYFIECDANGFCSTVGGSGYGYGCGDGYGNGYGNGYGSRGYGSRGYGSHGYGSGCDGHDSYVAGQSDMYFDYDLGGRRLDDVMGSLEDVRMKMNSALQLPPGFTTTIALKTGTARRLSTDSSSADPRRTNTNKAVMTFRIANQGANPVLPDVVAEQMKTQVSSGKSGMAAALSQIGSVNTQAGIPVASTQTRVQLPTTAKTSTPPPSDVPFSKLIIDAMSAAAEAAATMLKGGNSTVKTAMGQVSFFELSDMSADMVVQVSSVFGNTSADSPIVVSLPAGLVSMLLGQGTAVLQVFQFPALAGKLPLNDERGSVTIQSGIVDISILQEMKSNQSNQSNADNESVLTLAPVDLFGLRDSIFVRLSDADPHPEDRCAYFDEVVQRWSYSGTFMSTERPGSWCSTNHLTMFAILQAPDLRPTSTSSSLKSLVIAVVLGAVSFGLLLGLGALALACCATKPTQRHVQPFQPFQEENALATVAPGGYEDERLFVATVAVADAEQPE
ncbi:unnamed protein product, partial [Symbiodinium natans]